METLEALAALPGERIDVAHAALLLAREVQYPDLDPRPWLQRLDALAADARALVQGQDAHGGLDALTHFLFKHERFRGNSGDYHDPRNNYLNDVLARRMGIPITLSLVLVEIGRRLGFELFCVGLPGHCVVGARIGDERLYLDAFHRGVAVDREAMRMLVKHATGGGQVFKDEWLRPMMPHQLLARMCGNLQRLFVMQMDWPRAILATQRLHLFSRNPAALRDLGYLNFNAGHLARAADAFQSYLVCAVEPEDEQTIRENLASIYRRLGQLN